MIAPFYFAPFEGKILITNDSGCYAFLSEEDFQMFVKEDERLDPQIFEDLEEELSKGVDVPNGDLFLQPVHQRLVPGSQNAQPQAGYAV